MDVADRIIRGSSDSCGSPGQCDFVLAGYSDQISSMLLVKS